MAAVTKQIIISLRDLSGAYGLAGIQGTEDDINSFRGLVAQTLGEPQHFEDLALLPEEIIFRAFDPVPGITPRS